MAEPTATDSDKAVETTPLFSTEQLKNINTFEDAIALLAEAGVNVTDITDYGDGFAVMDKRTFVNVPFVILDYKFADGKYESDFVVVRIVTSDGRKALFTDGSTGIRKQLRDEVTAEAGIVVKNGLTVSEYTYIETNDKGEKVEKPAETFYLSM